MTAENFLQFAIQISFFLLVIGFILIILRLFIGPSLPDRILCLDMLVTTGIGFIAVITVATGYTDYLDVAIALGLVGFLATVAFARYVLHRGNVDLTQGSDDVVEDGS